MLFTLYLEWTKLSQAYSVTLDDGALYHDVTTNNLETKYKCLAASHLRQQILSKSVVYLTIIKGPLFQF